MSLSEQAAADYAKASGEERDAQRKELEEAAAGFTAPKELFEGGNFVVGALLVGIALVAIGGLFADDIKSGLSCATLAVFLLFPVVRILKRRKNVAMTLTPTGVLLSGAQEEIAWTDVESVDLHITGMPITTQTQVFLYLHDGVPKPVFSGDRRVRYIARRNAVRVTVVTYKDLRDKQLNEVLQNAHGAGIARSLLKEMH